MKIANSVGDLIGNTPLLELHNFQAFLKCEAHIIAKLEFFNPAGSVKDRVGKAMIEDAQLKGLLKRESVIIEPTSGNTGIGLVAIAKAKGYRVILTMPETMSIERRNLLKAYGAELVLTDGELGMTGSIEKAKELAKEIPNSFIPGQFTNKANPLVHKMTTGPEIWEDTEGAIDIFIAGIGTGGTITGTGEYLKEQNPNIKIVGVEPFASPFITKGISGPHMLQGIGAGFIPEIFNTKLCDEIITIKNEEAFVMCKTLTNTEGILVGISSGAVLKAAVELAGRLENRNKNIVVLLPDTGERYLTIPMYLD